MQTACKVMLSAHYTYIYYMLVTMFHCSCLFLGIWFIHVALKQLSQVALTCISMSWWCIDYFSWAGPIVLAWCGTVECFTLTCLLPMTGKLNLHWTWTMPFANCAELGHLVSLCIDEGRSKYVGLVLLGWWPQTLFFKKKKGFERLSQSARLITVVMPNQDAILAYKSACVISSWRHGVSAVMW